MALEIDSRNQSSSQPLFFSFIRPIDDEARQVRSIHPSIHPWESCTSHQSNIMSSMSSQTRSQSSNSNNNNNRDHNNDAALPPKHPILEWSFGKSDIARVKSLSFHSELPYLAASTFDGRIALWHVHHHTQLGCVRNAHGDIPEGHPHYHHHHSKRPSRKRASPSSQHYQPLNQHDDAPVNDDTTTTTTTDNIMDDDDDHECAHGFPVRSVHFHSQHALLASGGDDTTVCVWDCDNPHKFRPIVTLSGHADFVRCVAWHSGSLPWIVSASDDTTLRLWDLDQRTCLAILTGHEDYVMSAAWSPSGANYLLGGGASNYLLASASLDGTVRVWDYQNLYNQQYRDKKKQPKSHHQEETKADATATAGSEDGDAAPPAKPAAQSAKRSHQSTVSSSSSSAFFSLHMDVTAMFVMEGHSQAVNHVSFHPTLPILASASDDATVRLWRFSETGAWQLHCLSDQHAANVSSCLVADSHMALSVSEDGSVGVWHVGKSVVCQEQAFLSDDTRMWCMDYHHPDVPSPSGNNNDTNDNRPLVAVGHDHGFFVCRVQAQHARVSLPQAGSESSPAIRPRARILDDPARNAHNSSNNNNKNQPTNNHTPLLWAHELAEARVAQRPQEVDDQQPLTVTSVFDELHDWRILQLFPRVMGYIIVPAMGMIFLVNLPVLTILGLLMLAVLYGTLRCVRWIIHRQSSVKVHSTTREDDEESMVALVERSS